MAELGRSGYAAVLAYTTSRGAVFAGQQPRGLHRFDGEQAAALGQSTPFRLDLKRLAYFQVTTAWFPELELPGRGIKGRAPKALRSALQASLDDLLLSHKDLVAFLGLLWKPT